MAGSTAPAITSSLMAWPSRPSHNRSPLSTPSISEFPSSSSYPSLLSHESDSSFATSHTAMSSSTTLRDASVASWKGKGRASMDSEDVEDDEDLQRPRYPPPKKPLSPRQLGRIAQSFGIVIPSLPMPSPLESPNPGAATPPSRGRAVQALASPNIVHSPYLLTVIPPLSLLAVKGGSAEEAEKRTKRWKRGRLVPLQPTLGGMLLAIAREFGLPSTRGVNVYLSHRDDRSSSSSNSSFSASSPPYDEASGPQISSQTWSTLYGSYLVNSISRSSTPSSTPLRPSGPLGKDIAFPASPLSLLTNNSKNQPLSTPLKSAASLPVDGFPPTPQSVGTAATSRSTATVQNPIIGTIEFDVDEDLAGWYDDFRESGHRRKLSSLSDSGASTTGIRELRLVRNATKAKEKRQLRELDANLPRSAGNSPFAPSRRSVSAAEAMAILSQSKSAQRAHTLSTSLNAANGAMSHAGSVGEFTDGDISFGSTASEPIGKVGEASRSESDELLASPIELDVDELAVEGPNGARLSQQEIVERIQAELEKRGSALMMSDQLDDLERIMRSLSPREIRLTSPRMLTPRMAAKVANLQFPPHPTLKPRASTVNKSPLAESFNADHGFPDAPGPDFTRSASQDEPRGGPMPSWPSVPFVKLPNHASPGSPGSLEGYIRDASRPAERSPISEETLSRMKEVAPSPPPKESPDWRPRRPVRPPSPNLGPVKMLPQALDPEKVDVLRSPNRDSTDDHQRVRRSPSISLKSFRSIGGKKKNKDEPSPMPSQPSPGSGPFPRETVGLWKGSVSPSSSTFPGLKGANGNGSGNHNRKPSGHNTQGIAQTNEFGAIEEAGGASPAGAAHTSSTLPAKTGDSKSLGRFFNVGWGKRPSESPKHAQSNGHRKNDSSIDGTFRGPSTDHNGSTGPSPVISGPIPDTFIHHQAPLTHPHPTSSSESAPVPGVTGTGHRKTPTVTSFAESYSTTGPRASTSTDFAGVSPRGVRRKPVPGAPNSGSVDIDRGIQGSFSMNSVNSFVLEDPPKRRVPMGKTLI